MENKIIEKIEMEELIRLRDFHKAEYNRFFNLIRCKTEDNKRERSLRFIESKKTKESYINRKKDVDDLYKIIETEDRELHTKDVCDLLNERMEYTCLFDSGTIQAKLFKYIENDGRIYIRKEDDGRTNVYGLNKWLE